MALVAKRFQELKDGTAGFAARRQISGLEEEHRAIATQRVNRSLKNREFVLLDVAFDK
jgi:hypothetical protein